MKFVNIDVTGKVNNETPFFATGTSRVGEIDISYQKLVETFGKPNYETDGYKTDAEWLIFTIGGVATIYNYKDGKNYLGKEGLEIEAIRDWHIGGQGKGVVEWIEKALNI